MVPQRPHQPLLVYLSLENCRLWGSESGLFFTLLSPYIIYLFMIKLMTLPIAVIIQSQMTVWLMNNELGRMLQKPVVKLLSQHLPGEAD
jgi:hypothetical protein